MKQPLEKRYEVVLAFLEGTLDKERAAALLGCEKRTITSYAQLVKRFGKEGLVDHRHSNNVKLTEEGKQLIVGLKQQDRWRSARNVRDKFNLPVHESTVWRLFKARGLIRENRQRVKPIIRFEAEHPNDLWQTDIMGRIDFPKAGILYLIATLDDHSRFCPAGRWFKTQGKLNVFRIWYESLERWGLPKAMLQDEGSQYKARTRFGAADYQWYASLLKIELIWARRAQTKGKIERFWRFVQDDFVREVWSATSVNEINYRFREWLKRYNYSFKSRYFGNQTHADRYHPSGRRVPRRELQTMLTIEERRKVTRESTISLYGRYYYIPPGYIGCRIWVKIVGSWLLFEAGGKVFYRTRLKFT